MFQNAIENTICPSQAHPTTHEPKDIALIAKLDKKVKQPQLIHYEIIQYMLCFMSCEFNKDLCPYHPQ